MRWRVGIFVFVFVLHFLLFINTLMDVVFFKLRCLYFMPKKDKNVLLLLKGGFKKKSGLFTTPMNRDDLSQKKKKRERERKNKKTSQL